MTIFRRALRDRRRSTLWWVLGLLALNLLTLAFYPSIRGQQEFDDLVQQMPPALRDLFGMSEGISLSSAPGYLWARLFSSLLTVLLVIYAVVAGSACIGGSEEDGTLELILANPVTRRRVAAERLVAVSTLLALLGVVSVATLVLLAPPFHGLENISAGGLAAACAGAVTLAGFHLSLAFTAGAITGRRGPGLALGMVVAVGGFLAQGLLTAAGAPAWLRNLNPWFWYLESNLLAFGPSWEAWLPALLLSIPPAAVAIAIFERRDLR
ncbi:ABC transporter permease subunit [Tepidiforma sp.]|uniref:ABC transporter permease subunit n=1 Tax=Tepidiforma sp. TaxID=2682230 RepID=UPI002ADE763F|nr:ABC transporter permease subunit [Tepidiforma sp.]